MGQGALCRLKLQTERKRGRTKKHRERKKCNHPVSDYLDLDLKIPRHVTIEKAAAKTSEIQLGILIAEKYSCGLQSVPMV